MRVSNDVQSERHGRRRAARTPRRRRAPAGSTRSGGADPGRCRLAAEDALARGAVPGTGRLESPWRPGLRPRPAAQLFEARSEEHTSELQSLMRLSYAVFCLKKKTEHYMTRHKTQAETT